MGLSGREQPEIPGKRRSSKSTPSVTAHGPDTRIVTVTGELDALTAPALAAVLTETLAVAQVVVLSLDGVRYLASAGLRVLIEANDLAAEKGRDLRLVCHFPNANRVLDGSGLREHFNFADSIPKNRRCSKLRCIWNPACR